jgi:hypothetical protein
MKILLPAIVVAVLVASFASGQPAQKVEHAPTVEQCQADRAYWSSKLAQPVGKEADDVMYMTLLGWDAEMDKCQVVDPPNRWQYFNVGEEALAAMAIRQRDFINRHDMWQQFLDEDAAGKR